MAAGRFYVITALPPLGELGSAPPMSLSELVEHVADSPRLADLVRAVVLGDDLVQRDAFLAGQVGEVAPAVLTPRQVRNEEPLPGELAGEQPGEQPDARAVADSTWASYFRFAADVARRTGGGFLGEWVGFEVALRNALAAERARALGLQAEDYQVVAELADRGADVAETVAEWSSARDPLEGLRALDRRRWEWLRGHDRWFTFADDEGAAYAARLVLLHRWHRLARGEASQGPADGPSGRDSDERAPQ